MATAQRSWATAGALLRQWRERRRLSQLELSVQTRISSRHISFVETGRSTPSRELILRLADHLDVPLRERNPILLAAGFAPTYPETALDSPRLSAVRSAVRQVLAAHEPHPALAVDRQWNLLDANATVGLFTAGVAPDLLTPPLNVLRASLHPDGMASRIANLGEWRAHLLHRLRRQVAFTADPALSDLYEELRGYPCDQPEPEVEVPGPGDVVVPLRVRDGDRELTFLSTVTVFGAPLDITVAELAIESFFPADAATATTLHREWNGSG